MKSKQLAAAIGSVVLGLILLVVILMSYDGWQTSQVQSVYEDAAHGTGDRGTFVLGVRNDAATALAADGDYIVFMMDASGRLWTTAALSTTTDGTYVGDVGALGYDGSNLQRPRIDKSTLAYETTSHGEGEIHSGSAFTIYVMDVDWDDGDTMNVAFTTADSTTWLHVVPMVAATAVTTFTIQEGCTVTAGTGAAYLARNRNRNAVGSITSTVSSLAASPVVGEVSLNVTITVQGVMVHEEVLGADKAQGGNTGGVRDLAEYVLLANTTYCFVCENTGAGADNMIASMELSWYEHADLVASW